MAKIVLIKFVSGEEIIADLVSDSDNTKVIKDAVTLVYRPQEGGSMTVGFAPFMPYSEGSITLYDTSILGIGEPQEDLKREFDRIFGSGIVVAQANDSVFKV